MLCKCQCIVDIFWIASSVEFRVWFYWCNEYQKFTRCSLINCLAILEHQKFQISLVHGSFVEMISHAVMNFLNFHFSCFHFVVLTISQTDWNSPFLAKCLPFSKKIELYWALYFLACYFQIALNCTLAKN